MFSTIVFCSFSLVIYIIAILYQMLDLAYPSCPTNLITCMKEMTNWNIPAFDETGVNVKLDMLMLP